MIGGTISGMIEVGINRSAVQKHVDRLKPGLLRRDGADSGGIWIIVKPD
jgi:hypothetical protein